MKKTALVLLNMGGVRNKDELGTFLRNMFNDKNIISIPNDLIRSMITSLIVTFRLDKAWGNYEQIGGSSPLHDLTDKLVNKLQAKLKDGYYVVEAMRYTSPFAQTAIARIKAKNIQDVILLPLYPQYSTTTTKSSLEDFLQLAGDDFNIQTIEPFYKNDTFNEAICDEIIRVRAKYNDYHLIFSAHGLPQKVVDKGDPYQKQLLEQVELLKEKFLTYENITFKSINLAYQSKVGPLKWLEPSLENTLKYLKNEKVIIYPISFIIDNSETVFELDIEYREIAHKIGIRDYKVCKCINDDDKFCKMIKEIIK